jgi:regulatory protein
MDFLARREYSRWELHQKLSHKFPECSEIDQVLEQLSIEGLQADSRFADSFFRLRVNSGYGPKYIQAELRQRGISDSLIDDVFTEQNVDWSAVARALFEKKYGNEDMSDTKLRAKCTRYMQYKGFGFDHIRELF